MPDLTTRLNLPKPLGNELHTRAKLRELIDAIDTEAADRDMVEPKLTNRSGGALVVGDVVVPDSANDSSVVSTTTADMPGALVSLEAPADLTQGRFALIGHVAKVNVIAGVARGQWLSTSTTAKQARGTASRTAGSFAVALTSRDVNGQVVAIIVGGGGAALADAAPQAIGAAAVGTSEKVARQDHVHAGAHASLSGVGTNTHSQIDTHIAATAAHGATGAVVGTTNVQTLSGKTVDVLKVVNTVTNATANHQLPAANANGNRMLWVRAAGGDRVITSAGGDIFVGTVQHAAATGFTAKNGDSYTFWSDGTNWYVV